MGFLRRLAGFTQPSSQELRRRALRVHLEASRGWIGDERAKRLSRRAWNLERAAAMAELAERAARSAAYDAARGWK